MRKIFLSSLLFCLFLGSSTGYGIARLWVTNSDAGTVNGYDIQPDTLDTTISTGTDDQPFGIKISPDGSQAFVTLSLSDAVQQISLSTNTIINTFSVPPLSSPLGLDFTPDGQKVYVAGSGNERVSIIDVSSGTVTQVDLGVGVVPIDIAISFNGQFAFISDFGTNALRILQLSTNTTPLPPISVGTDPTDLAFHPDGIILYVVNSGSNNVSCVNANTFMLKATIPVGNSPSGIAVTPDGTRVYVGNGGDNTLSIIDTSSNQVIQTFPIGTSPKSIAISPDGTRIYVTALNDTVLIIDRDTSQILNSVPTGLAPQGIDITPDGQSVYVANFDTSNVSAFSADTSSSTIKVGNFPTYVIAGNNGKIYVSNTDSNTISIIDGGTNEVEEEIDSFGEKPAGLLLLPFSTDLYVANSGSGTIAKIDINTHSLLRLYDLSGFFKNKNVGQPGDGPEQVHCTRPTGGGSFRENLREQRAFLQCQTLLMTPTPISDEVVNVIEETGEVKSTDQVGSSIDTAPLVDEKDQPIGSIAYSIDDTTSKVKIYDVDPTTEVAKLSKTVPVSKQPSFITTFPTASNKKPSVLVLSESTMSQTTLTGSGKELKTFSLTGGPQQAVVASDAKTGYTTIPSQNIVVVMDLNSGAIINTIASSGGPFGVALTPILPLGVLGQAERNVFLSQIDLFNRLIWSPPPIGTIDEYRIFRDQALTDLAGIVPGDVRVFDDHNRKKGETTTYFIEGISGGAPIAFGATAVTSK